MPAYIPLSKSCMTFFFLHVDECLYMMNVSSGVSCVVAIDDYSNIDVFSLHDFDLADLKLGFSIVK
ncbi:hypothetical protein Hdeb2414_s0026g00673451 [Helianthus debilis subsp. tardiflorus]